MRELFPNILVNYLTMRDKLLLNQRLDCIIKYINSVHSPLIEVEVKNV